MREYLKFKDGLAYKYRNEVLVGISNIAFQYMVNWYRLSAMQIRHLRKHGVCAL